MLIPNAPLGLITTASQALAGVLLSSATDFLLLCNDKAVLGPWVNKAWLNVVASVIVGVLVMLSLILAATTLCLTWDVGVLKADLVAGADGRDARFARLPARRGRVAGGPCRRAGPAALSASAPPREPHSPSRRHPSRHHKMSPGLITAIAPQIKI